MIDFIKGLLTLKESDYVVIDVGGVGYKIFIQSNILIKLPQTAEEIIIYTHLIHKEEVMELYGFLSVIERSIFRNLLSVSGIGPKLSMKILSDIPYNEVIRAVLNKDSVFLSKVNGLGKKTSEKLILELENKFKKLYPYPVDIQENIIGSEEKTSVEALMSLGYREKECIEAVRQVIKTEKLKSTEDIVKSSLKILAGL